MFYDDLSLPNLLEQARLLTETHFHRRIKLFAPLYVANFCVNHCRYCGFQGTNDIRRVHLTYEEVLRELDILQGRGFRNVLLVAGENPERCTPGYFAEIIREMRRRGMEPSVEIAPQTEEGYGVLAEAGCRSVTLFQETYHEELYREYHPRGPKSSFAWRHGAYERAGTAGFRFFGLGVLLGLAPPREEILKLAEHARELLQKFPGTKISFSLPRIRTAPHGFQPPYPVSDDLFARLYGALRMRFPEAELVLSTRETPEMRDMLYASCITYTSAGSQTAPGGYHAEQTGNFSGEQFPTTDRRSAEEVARGLEAKGMVVEW